MSSGNGEAFMRRNSLRALSLMEALVALSIFATIAILAAPTVADAKRRIYIARCESQLQEISLAIQHYQKDHGGKLPASFGMLLPRYLDDRQVLVCPFERAHAPDMVQSRLQRASERGKTWSTYILYSQPGLDYLAARGAIELGYSEVLKRRGASTPVVICREHREPFSLNPFLGVVPAPREAASYPVWDFPDEPILVLRYDGQLEKSTKGGTRIHNTAVSTLFELETI